MTDAIEASSERRPSTGWTAAFRAAETPPARGRASRQARSIRPFGAHVGAQGTDYGPDVE
jgi:hypothetical protein